MENKKLLDFELIRKIKEGDKIAFEILFYIFHNQLYNYAVTFVKRKDIAEEIIQETFIKLWDIRYTLDETLSVKSFLYRCVHNQCLNYIRNMQIDKRLTAAYIDEIKYRFQIIDSEPMDDWFDENEMDRLNLKIHQIIDELPGQCREIFILSRFKNLSYQEIADTMFLSINTIKTQIKRALQKIRSSF